MKTAFKPSFVPTRTYTHPILGKIDEYRFTGRDAARFRNAREDAESGVQASFIPNNARPHRDNEYALKVYFTLTEAAAAWERQNQAARKGVAPPVRRLCKFVDAQDGKVWWGYQTCVASHIYNVGGADCLRWYDIDFREAGSMLTPAQKKFVRAVASMRLVGTINDSRVDGRLKRYRSRKVVFHGDMHEGNIGFYKHKMVLIDFGFDSVSIGGNR
jgi:hypothetical protein